MKMNIYYELNQIKDIFKAYKDSIDLPITEEEYDIFCRQLVQIPKDKLDIINKNIYFVLLSANPTCTIPACLINLDDRKFNGKNALIILTPLIFGYPPGTCSPGPEKILHEIAHFDLGHNDYLNREDIEKKEKEADKLAANWLNKYFLATDRENET
ncbi:MAG: hypothetical protein WCB96_11915 [Candidatus Aminicenantales bacterium]